MFYINLVPYKSLNHLFVSFIMIWEKGRLYLESHLLVQAICFLLFKLGILNYFVFLLFWLEFQYNIRISG